METTVSANGRTFARVAWTGGDTPPRRCADPDCRAVRRAFFRESVAICGGLDLWACAGTTALDRARIFWNQARLDAWRTIDHARRPVPSPVVGERLPGYSRIVSPVVRVESWGPGGLALSPIDPRDRAAAGWSTLPDWRLSSPGTGTAHAVRVDVTGRTPRRWSGDYWVRGRVEFCGDSEPSTFAPCWILLK